MNKELANLIDHLADPLISETSVITWGSPVLSFGNPCTAKIATLGLNPSNREFTDINGNELEGDYRRFHTLNSLGLTEWSEITDNHLTSIVESFENYFFRNPYDGWFKKLDYLISGTAISYYFPSAQACHLDLIPYATSSKWTDVSNEHREYLLDLTGNILGLLLKQSSIQVLVLNGQSVVENFEKLSNLQFEKRNMTDWTLPRKENGGVIGYSYIGKLNTLAGVNLEKEICVLGYNHNIQSSFGVTKEVQNSIRNWITMQAKEILK